MLQRAASNAYTWWWASHIRTKQSKWLDNDIHEMEEKVKAMIKLIDEDADSFAKKAEMYFKRRPELINCVEEAFRAYKALADRYDRLSGDLHKANHQLATAFPDHVPMLEEDDDDDYSSQHELSSTDPNPPQPDASNSKHPKPPPELPRMLSSRMKKPERPTPPRKSPQNRSFSSPIDRDKAQEEIDRLQKRILALQTEKEFFKSSYEKGLAKYWDLENQMTELQEEISELQYDFSVGSLIEDDEARALMTASALKSCEDTLVSLQEQQKRSNEEADHESLRLRFARAKLRFLKGEATDTSDVSVSSSTVTDEEIIGNLNSERLDINSICEKVRLHFQMSSESSVALLAEKIDELVEKIIGLEVTVSSQTMQIQRLSTETEDLHKYLRGVEEDKKNLICDSNSLNERLTKAEIELKRLQALEKSVQDEKGVVHNHFAEACTTLNDLSEKIQSTPIEEDIEQVKEEISVKVVEEPKDVGVDENAESSKPSQAHDRSASSPELLQILSGIEGRDKILLNEYSSIIQNFNETRQRLSDIERRNQECHSETMQQIKELRCANAIKDEEIKNLRRKLFTSESMRIKSMKKSASQQQMDKLEAVEEETPEVLPSGGTDTDPIEDQQTKLLNFDQVFSTSPLVEKFRADIDTLLEENLDFWLRFSSSYHQIQKFQTSFKELQAEAHRATEIKSQGGVRIVAPPSSGSSSSSSSSSTDTTQTERKLRELNSELQVWLEHNRLLHGELRCRFSSISSIQDEITKVTNSNEGEEVLFTPYQAAKFQGEVINMQQENNKVAKEIQAGLDHVKGLQLEVGRALSRLHQKYELSGTSKSQHQPYKHLSSTKSRVPLKTFLFGVKPKKQSIFACMNPAFHHSHSHKGDSSDHGHSKH